MSGREPYFFAQALSIKVTHGSRLCSTGSYCKNSENTKHLALARSGGPMHLYLFYLTATDEWLRLSRDERIKWLSDKTALLQETAVTLPNGARSGVSWTEKLDDRTILLQWVIVDDAAMQGVKRLIESADAARFFTFRVFGGPSKDIDDSLLPFLTIGLT